MRGHGRIQMGETLDVTYHDDVHFAEYNSMDENGRYLDPADYQEIELGIMEQTEDAREMIAALLGEMGFGEGIGNWDTFSSGRNSAGSGSDTGRRPGRSGSDTGGRRPGRSRSESTAGNRRDRSCRQCRRQWLCEYTESCAGNCRRKCSTDGGYSKCCAVCSGAPGSCSYPAWHSPESENAQKIKTV